MNQKRFIEHLLWPEAILGAKDLSVIVEAKPRPHGAYSLGWEREN